MLEHEVEAEEKSMTRICEVSGVAIKRPTLEITGIDEGELQAKGIDNMFNKIVVENFPNVEKEIVIQEQEVFWAPNRQDQKKTSLCHITVKD
jgi:hypothetical protein